MSLAFSPAVRGAAWWGMSQLNPSAFSVYTWKCPYTHLHISTCWDQTQDDVSWQNSHRAVKLRAAGQQMGSCVVFLSTPILPLEVCVSTGGTTHNIPRKCNISANQTALLWWQISCFFGVFWGVTGLLWKNTPVCAEYWFSYLIKDSYSESPLIIHPLRLSNNLLGGWTQVMKNETAAKSTKTHLMAGTKWGTVLQ